jgi:hypothetical protein
MAGEEERKKRKEQIKEEYKRELQKRKEILEQAKRLRHSRNINQAIEGITGALNDDTDEWIYKLDQESSLTEAKIDLAMESAASSVDELEKERKQAEADKFSAEQLLKEMKQDMGLLTDDLDDEDDLTQELNDEIKQEEESRRQSGKSFGDI